MYDPREYWTRRPLEQGETYVGPGGVREDSDDQKDEFCNAINDALFRQLALPVPSLLDFGCGSGRFTRFLASRCNSYLGVDISPTGIAQAKIRHPGDKFIWMNQDRIPIPQSTIDLVVAITVFQHIPDESFMLWARQIRRALKTHGKTIIIDASEGEAPHMFLRPPGALAAALRRRIKYIAKLPRHYITIIEL